MAATPIYLPYRRVAVEQGMTRNLDSVVQFSATLDGYLASYSRLHGFLWNAGAPREFPDAFFPGIVVGLLAAVALALAVSGRCRGPVSRGQIVTLAGLCIVGIVLSLGTRTPLYGWLYAVFPPMSGLRAAARFGGLFLLGTAMLGGIGLSEILKRVPRIPAACLGVAALLLVTLEALRPAIGYTKYEGIPQTYSWLAREPGPVVLVEVPFYLPPVIFQNAEYVLNSTAHWRPLMNGYSGYTPATYRQYAPAFSDFPDPRAVNAMRAAGGTHLMVHPRRYGADAEITLTRALANPALERVAVGRDGITLFRIR